MLRRYAVRLDEHLEGRRGTSASLPRLLREVHRLLGLHAVDQHVAGHQVELVLLPLLLLGPVGTHLLERADGCAEVLAAHRGVLLGAALVARDLHKQEVRICGDGHLGHLRIVEELVERFAGLCERALLVCALRLTQTCAGDRRGELVSGEPDGALEGLVREIPALRIDQRLASRKELLGGVCAVGSEHLCVDFSALALHAHLDERFREVRLGVLGLVGIGECARQPVESLLRLVHLAERRIDCALLHIGGLGVLALRIRRHVRIVCRRRLEHLLVAQLGASDLLQALAETPAALAREEQRRLPEFAQGLALTLAKPRVAHSGLRLRGELLELLDGVDDLDHSVLDGGVLGLFGLVRLAAVQDVHSVLLVHLRELHVGDALVRDRRLDGQVGAIVALGLLAVAQLVVGLRHLEKRDGIVGRVGVVLLDIAPVAQRLLKLAGLAQLATLAGSDRSSLHVAAVVRYKPCKEAVCPLKLAALNFFRGARKYGVACRGHYDIVAVAGETLGQIALDRVRIVAVLRLDFGVLLVVNRVQIAVDHVLDSRHRLLYLRILRQDLHVVRDRLEELLGHVLLPGGLELRGPDARDILGGHLRLDLGVVLLHRELANFLSHLAGERSPRRHLEARKDRDREREGTLSVARTVLVFLAEHVALDKLVVVLGLRKLLLCLLPKHFRLEIHHLRKRRNLEKPQPALGIGLAYLVVDALKILLELLDDEVGALDVAPQLLEVGLHADGAAEQHGVLALEALLDQLVDRVADDVERPVALRLLLGRAVFGDAHQKVAVLGGERKPVLARQVGQKLAVYLGRLVVVLRLRKYLAVGVAGIDIELLKPLGRFWERRKELVVDLDALFLLVATEVVVGHLEPRRPVLRALAVGQRGDLLLGLVEPA